MGSNTIKLPVGSDRAYEVERELIVGDGVHAEHTVTAAAHQHLVNAGVGAGEIQHFVHGTPEPGPDPDRAPFNSFIFFADPDGNRWAIQEGIR